MMGEKAGFWSRVAAYLIDWIILLIIFFIFQQFAHTRFSLSLMADPAAMMAQVLTALFLSIFLTVMFFAYFTYFHSATGQTLGKMLLRIKVVSTEGNDIGYSVSFVRCLAYQASWSSLGLGFLWVAFQAEGQSWHDRIAGTKVIKV